MTQGVGLAFSSEWSEGIFGAIANNPEEANYLCQKHKAEAAMSAAQRQSRH